MIFTIETEKGKHYFKARTLIEAKQYAFEKVGNVSSLQLIVEHKERKSPILNKRQWIQKSKTIYNRNNSKEQFRKDFKKEF